MRIFACDVRVSLNLSLTYREPLGRRVVSFPPNAFIKISIKLGTNLKTADHFREALKQSGYSITDWANDILRKLSTANKEVDVDLVKVSISELGFKKGANYSEICEKALCFELELCPAEVGPQLRLQYPDQPKNEWLGVAMTPLPSTPTSSNGSLSLWRAFFPNPSPLIHQT